MIFMDIQPLSPQFPQEYLHYMIYNTEDFVMNDGFNI